MTQPLGTQPTGSAAEIHDGMAAAYQAQRDRLSPSKDMWSACAGSFKPDLEKAPGEFLSKVASYLNANDVLLDIGGGAGRLSLPLASRCGEVICVDPSPAMGESFEATVRDAEIANARFVLGGWPDAAEVEGDVALVAHVTFFVPRIVPFIERLNLAARRRVLIGTWSVPAPNQLAPFFMLARAEELAPVPGHHELLNVLREMSIDAKLIDAGEAPPPATAPIGATLEDAIKIEVEGGIRLGVLPRDDADRCSELFLQHFDELFVKTGQGFRRRNGLGARELIITWETRG